MPIFRPLRPVYEVSISALCTAANILFTFTMPSYLAIKGERATEPLSAMTDVQLKSSVKL